MKNITLSVDEKSLKAARVYAAEHDTSVNALIREFLDGLARKSAETTAAERQKIREELAELGRRSPGDLGEWKWNRDDIYRERLSRYEHPGLRRYGEEQGRSKGKPGK